MMGRIKIFLAATYIFLAFGLLGGCGQPKSYREPAAKALESEAFPMDDELSGEASKQASADAGRQDGAEKLITEDMLEGLTVYHSVTVGEGAEGAAPEDCEAFIADLIPGESLQLLTRSRKGIQRHAVWEKGVDYEDEREDFSLEPFEELFGDETGFFLHLTMSYLSDIKYFSCSDGTLREIAFSWGQIRRIIFLQM